MKVKLLETNNGTIVQARVHGKKVELRPYGHEDSSYCSDQSAQRAWRKVARKSGFNPNKYRYILA